MATASGITDSEQIGNMEDPQGHEEIGQSEEQSVYLRRREVSPSQRKEIEEIRKEIRLTNSEDKEELTTLTRSAAKKEAELQKLRTQIELRRKQARLNEERQVLREMMSRISQSRDEQKQKASIDTNETFDKDTKDSSVGEGQSLSVMDSRKDKLPTGELSQKESVSIQRNTLDSFYRQEKDRYETTDFLHSQGRERGVFFEAHSTPKYTTSVPTEARRSSIVQELEREIRNLDLRLQTIQQEESQDIRRKRETEQFLKSLDKPRYIKGEEGEHGLAGRYSSEERLRRQYGGDVLPFSGIKPVRKGFSEDNELSDRNADNRRRLTVESTSKQMPAKKPFAFEIQQDNAPVNILQEDLYGGVINKQSGAEYQFSKIEYERLRNEAQQRKVILLTQKEEELRRKEMELDRREQFLKFHEQMKKETDESDPYEKILKEKERQLQLKLKKLQEREQQIKLRESALISNEDITLKETDDKAIKKKTNQIEREETQVIKLPEEKVNQAEKVTEQAPKERQEREEAIPKDTKISEAAKDSINNESISYAQDKTFLYPKFTVFSGEDPKPKGEATFEEWKYEVCCALKDDVYKEYAVAQAIRKSLKAQAKRVLLPMGTSAKVQDILERLEGVFGNVATGESVLQEFYTSAQKADESVTAWGLRLEEILQKAIVKGHVKPDDKNDMLRNNFWKHLRSDRLKNATRVHFESISNFELLRRAVRAEEYEIKVSSGIQHQPTQSGLKAETTDSKTDTLLNRLATLEKELKEMKKNRPVWYQRKNQNNPPKKEETVPKENTTSHLN